MANKTVYPYGTGGQLPSSIGIINDLKTGGADKALAAEQGVVIGNDLTKLNKGAELIDINLSFLARKQRAISTSTGKWTSSTDYKHVFICVKVGERYRITANNDQQSVYAFLTSDTVTSGSNAPFVTGTSTNTVAPGSTAEFQIPEGCVFLYLYSGTTGSGGSGRQGLPQSLVRFVPTIESINDLSDGMKGISGKRQLVWAGGSITASTGVADTSITGRIYCDYVDISGMKKMRYLRAKTTASSPTWGMAFYDSEKTYISGQAAIGSASAYGTQDTIIDVPAGAVYARITLWTNSVSVAYLIDAYSLEEFSKDIPAVEELLGYQGTKRTICPKFMYIGYNGSTGKIWGEYQGTGLYSTPRFIAVAGREIGVTVGKDLDHLGIFEYAADFSFLQRTNISSIVADTKEDFTLLENTAYIKILLCAASDYSEDSKADVKVEGVFAQDWDVFNLRSTDSGYQNIAVSVRVTDPTCCDSETATVQDASQILSDYGVICLPTQYRNTGRPTRLIIYCHGAAVNYASNASRFNSQDLEPQYWLKEGYAVMDMEGNPFDNVNEHICIPQAMDCYVAAYKWAIEFYNICRDGVFLGGRSMGGQNAFNLIRRECPIPVIACCPNSAAPDLSFGYSDTAARKSFCSTHMGFVLPEGFTWSDGLCNATEKAVIADNWDKYIKCCPQLAACSDLPSKETLIENMYGEAKIALWSTLHMFAKCPVKLFGCNQDPSCTPSQTTKLYYKMLMNAGQICECRMFNTTLTAKQHHYDTQDPNLRADITTSYGEELTNIPIVYIEMLAFWRRYEQGL